MRRAGKSTVNKLVADSRLEVHCSGSWTGTTTLKKRNMCICWAKKSEEIISQIILRLAVTIELIFMLNPVQGIAKTKGIVWSKGWRWIFVLVSVSQRA